MGTVPFGTVFVMFKVITPFRIPWEGFFYKTVPNGTVPNGTGSLVLIVRKPDLTVRLSVIITLNL